MSKRESSAGLIVEKRLGMLRPVSSFDAEAMAGFPDGSEFDVVPRKKRSNPQNRRYWQMLKDMLAATWLSDQYPNEKKLHNALLRDLGFIHVGRDLDGKPYLERDSTAFDQMKPHEFNEYFERAIARLSELTGVDPVSPEAGVAA